jgi:hypothetical protein
MVGFPLICEIDCGVCGGIWSREMLGLSDMIRGIQMLNAILILLALMFAGCSRSQFVHANGQNQNILIDRTSKQMCWAGPENDLDGFMAGETIGAGWRPARLPLCKDLNRQNGRKNDTVRYAKACLPISG